MSEHSSEQRLIAACQTGDREAFRQLFETYQDRVWSIALHFTGEEQTARDVTQQVFLKLFGSIKQFRSEANFTTWLYRLVANACLDEQRRGRRFISFDFWVNSFSFLNTCGGKLHVSAAKSAYLPSLYCATFFAMGSSGTFQGSRASSFSRLSASPICAST